MADDTGNQSVVPPCASRDELNSAKYRFLCMCSTFVISIDYWYEELDVEPWILLLFRHLKLAPYRYACRSCLQGAV